MVYQQHENLHNCFQPLDHAAIKKMNSVYSKFEKIKY